MSMELVGKAVYSDASMTAAELDAGVASDAHWWFTRAIEATPSR